MKLKIIFIVFIIFIKTYGQTDSISVTMPDKTIFKISQQENKLLEKYKAQPEKYDFKTEAELLDRFKEITLKKREIAQIKAETEQIDKRIAQTEKETEQIRAETEQIRTEKEQIQQKLNSVNQDIKELDKQYKEIFEKQLGRQITEDERKKYFSEVVVWDKWHNEMVINLKKVTETKNKIEAKKLLEEVKKQKKSDLPFINKNNEILKTELEKILKL